MIKIIDSKSRAIIDEIINNVISGLYGTKNRSKLILSLERLKESLQ